MQTHPDIGLMTAKPQAYSRLAATCAILAVYICVQITLVIRAPIAAPKTLANGVGDCPTTSTLDASPLPTPNAATSKPEQSYEVQTMKVPGNESTRQYASSQSIFFFISKFGYYMVLDRFRFDFHRHYHNVIIIQSVALKFQKY